MKLKDEVYQDNLTNYFYLDKRIASVYEAIEDAQYRLDNQNHYTRVEFHDLGFSVRNFSLEREVIDNADADTYSPMDLFDWIELISSMKEEGYTQQEIGERIGWARTKVANHLQIISEIVTPVLDISKRHQKGRVTSDVTNVTFNFTEGRFTDDFKSFSE